MKTLRRLGRLAIRIKEGCTIFFAKNEHNNNPQRKPVITIPYDEQDEKRIFLVKFFCCCKIERKITDNDTFLS